MDISIEPFDPARHDTDTVARLIYQADPSLMRLVFGEESEAVRTIGKLVGMEHNDYSGRRIICATYDGEVVGMIAGLDGAEKQAAAKGSGKEWGRALGPLGMVRALRYGPKLEGVSTTDLDDEEFYISALTVDARHRGTGIGSRLLGEVLRDHDVVVTDVNIAKADSIRFYERHGFKVGGERTFAHKGHKIGNRPLRRG